jgi:hypothetical protein
MLSEVNPYAQAFKSIRDLVSNNPTQALHLWILAKRSKDARTYNIPTGNEVAAIMVSDGSEDVDHQDVVVQDRQGGLRRISKLHPAYMPMSYALMFPYGEDGWHPSIPVRHVVDSKPTNGEEFADESDGDNDSEGGEPNSTRRKCGCRTITMNDYYAFRLQERDNEASTILRCGRLLQQYIVDVYVAIEQSRLNYLRRNQKKLRADLYQALQDVLEAGDTDTTTLGTRIVLPSSFTSGPRFMVQLYQDAMAICRSFGLPSYFIMFTCNPNWPEIQAELLPGQIAIDRPDLVTRMFHMKLLVLIKDLMKDEIFGPIVTQIHVIEFQKQGLPHAHILIILNPDRPLLPRLIWQF